MDLSLNKFANAFFRNRKHLSIILCLSAGEACVTPDLVSSQASEPVQRVSRRLDCATKPISTARASQIIFANYIRRVFIPHLAMLHLQAEFAEEEEEAVVLTDNYPAHITQ
jgi:hypothetical protein